MLSITNEVEEANLDVIQEVVVRDVHREQHFLRVEELWCYLIRERATGFRNLLLSLRSAGLPVRGCLTVDYISY